MATALQVKDSDIVCRLYAATEEKTAVDVRMSGLQSVGLRSLSGEKVTDLEPYQIGELVLKPEV